MPFFSIDNEQLHYRIYGSGERVLLAFHGYGQDAGVYDVFAMHTGRMYTLIAIDLPGHGATEWTEGKTLTPGHLSTLIANICRQWHVTQVTLMGYSIGGRVALAAMMAVPDMIYNMVLMASDGLTVNKWYRFCTKSLIGKQLFSIVLAAGDTGVRLAGILRSLRLIPDAMYRLSIQAMGSKAARAQLRLAWPALKECVHKPEELRAVIKKNSIPVYIFMGRRDRVLPPVLALSLAEGADTIKVTTTDRGHRIFDAGNAAMFVAPLLKL